METPMNGEAAIDELRERFAAWRAGKSSRREPIPGELWDGAIQLAQSSSVARVAKILRLCSSTLKQKMLAQREPTPRAAEVPEFVRTSLGAVASQGTGSPSEMGWRLTIERQDGTTLKIAVPRADRDDLLRVATQFLG